MSEVEQGKKFSRGDCGQSNGVPPSGNVFTFKNWQSLCLPAVTKYPPAGSYVTDKLIDDGGRAGGQKGQGDGGVGGTAGGDGGVPEGGRVGGARGQSRQPAAPSATGEDEGGA